MNIKFKFDFNVEKDLSTISDGKMVITTGTGSNQSFGVVSLSKFIESLNGKIQGTSNGGNSNTSINSNTLDTLSLHNASTFEYEAEKWRWLGQSGVVGARQYNQGGSRAFERPFDISFSPISIHQHNDYYGLQGLGEIAISVNGYYIRSRHNDYAGLMPHSTLTGAAGYQKTEVVPKPELPAYFKTTTDSVATQVLKMKDLYDRLNNTIEGNVLDPAKLLTTEERKCFRWDMAYAEVWWEILSDNAETDDPGNDTRHTNITNNVKAMLRQAQYFNYGGHKDPKENTGYWVAAVKEVNENGTLSYAVLKFRILTVPVADMSEYTPKQLFDVVKDYKAIARNNTLPNVTVIKNFEELGKHKWGRFKVKESRDSYGILDYLVSKIPGLDNKPANILEHYSHPTEEEDIIAAFKYNPISKQYTSATTETLNSGYYFRFNRIINTDASGRRLERRGFNDPYLFVAMNTQEKVKKYSVNGRDYRFSYMIPLEMIMRHPVEVWNPHGLKLGTEAQAKGTAAVKRDGTTSKPFLNYFERVGYYLTPKEFFQGEGTPDPANTAKASMFIEDKNGVGRQVVASGTYFFLPSIFTANNKELKIRMRYPIYPVFHEGSYAYAEIEALKEVLTTSDPANIDLT